VYFPPRGGRRIDIALVRAVPDSFVDALVGASSVTLDVERARGQHVAYVSLLESAGYAIAHIAADERHPDSVFVEDTAVVVQATAVIARSGAPARRGEGSGFLMRGSIYSATVRTHRRGVQ
jgi:dimethylargininase